MKGMAVLLLVILCCGCSGERVSPESVNKWKQSCAFTSDKKIVGTVHDVDAYALTSIIEDIDFQSRSVLKHQVSGTGVCRLTHAGNRSYYKCEEHAPDPTLRYEKRRIRKTIYFDDNRKPFTGWSVQGVEFLDRTAGTVLASGSTSSISHAVYYGYLSYVKSNTCGSIPADADVFVDAHE